MKRSLEWKTPACCKSQNVLVMDYAQYGEKADPAIGSPRVNRMCMTCRTRWIGRPNRVRELRWAEWENCFAADKVMSRPAIANLAASFVKAFEGLAGGHSNGEYEALRRELFRIGLLPPETPAPDSNPTAEVKHE